MQSNTGLVLYLSENGVTQELGNNRCVSGMP